MSSHNEIQDMIPDFAVGRASDADRQLIETHLRDCAECRAMVEECAAAATDLRELVATESLHHPEPGQFALFTDGALKGEGLLAFELHIDLCAECAEKLATINQLEREVDYTPAAGPAGSVSPARGGLRKNFTRPVLIYGVAFAAIALMAVPVVRSLLRSDSPPGISGGEKVVQLAEQTRSGLSRQIITMSSEQKSLELEIRFIPLLDRTYSVTVATEAGRAIYTSQLSVDQMQNGAVTMRLIADDLLAGDYSAILTSTPTLGDPFRVYYPFTIKR